ncbi:MAG: EamA family transporter [Alphaproteobacteria bacterium]
MTDDAAPAPARSAALWLLILLLIAEAIIFALHVMVNKVAVDEGLPTFGYTFWYSFGAGLILLIICALRGDLPPMRPRHVLTYLIIGTTGLAFPFTLMTFVAPKLPASIVSMLVVLSPLMTYLFALLARLERFRWLSLIGILLGFAGVLLLILPEASLPAADMVGWVLLCLLAPASFGLTNVLAAVLRPPAISSLAMSATLLLGASVVLFPIMLALGQSYSFPGPALGGDLALLYAVLINLVLWTLFLEVVRLAGPVFFAQFNYLVVLAGFGFGVLFFGERPSLYIIAAAALMAAGLAVLNWRRRRRAEPAPASLRPAVPVVAPAPLPAEPEPEPVAEVPTEAAPPGHDEALQAASDTAAAETAEAEAAFQRGVAAYAEGDHATALSAFRLAAAQGSAEARFNLGVMYANGRGVAADATEALRLYREAAALGVADACNNLGHMYEKGLGVAQDHAEAAAWYRKAAMRGKPYAQHNLGALYANGQGIAQDSLQAYVWFTLAIAHHEPGAARELSAQAREQVKRRLSAEQIAEAERIAAGWKPEGASEPAPAAAHGRAEPPNG